MTMPMYINQLLYKVVLKLQFDRYQLFFGTDSTEHVMCTGTCC